MADTPLLDDFGEKIGGAKKDLWRRRGLISDDLTAMNWSAIIKVQPPTQGNDDKIRSEGAERKWQRRIA